MKRGYHSTQDKVFGSIPRSEFLGVAVGFALGMIAHGLLHLEGSKLEIAGAAVGFLVGYVVDRKFFAEKDVPPEEIEAAENAVEVKPADTEAEDDKKNSDNQHTEE